MTLCSTAGVGDIIDTGGSFEAWGAVLKAPNDLVLTGTVVGIPTDDTPGTLPCTEASNEPFDQSSRLSHVFDRFVTEVLDGNAASKGRIID